MSHIAPRSHLEAERERRVLGVRLRREVARGKSLRQAGCAAVALLAVATLTGVGRWRSGPSDDSAWVLVIFAVVFGSLGLLVLAGFVHQLLAARVRETIVELDVRRPRRGETTHLCVRQEGPARLDSLRVNIVRLERTHQKGQAIGERQAFTLNVLDEFDIAIGAEEFFERLASFTLPEEEPPTARTGDIEQVWRVEVWGRVVGWPDFLHVFVIPVR